MTAHLQHRCTESECCYTGQPSPKGCGCHQTREQMASARIECLEAKVRAVTRHIPMDYLQRHDKAGATGPTEALNLEAAMKDYAEDRWKALDRIKAVSAVNAELVAALERIATVDMGGGFLGAQACRQVARTALSNAKALEVGNA